jgi:hypothetical protein
MAIKDDKQKVFGKIAALRTLNDGYPEFKLTNSFPSINNGKDSMDFLIDLIKSLIGLEEIREIIVDILATKLDDIEIKIKQALKDNLKEFVSCGVNPSIPSYLLNSSTGIDIEVKKIDFLNLFQIDPLRAEGPLFYNDNENGVNSTDLNTFLYESLQNDGVTQNWGNQTGSNDILDIEFNSVGTTVNNVLNVKASSYYSSNKKLTDLNNDVIDSIDLFDADKVINNIIDTLFGSVANLLRKTPEALTIENQINTVIENLLNSEDDDIIDDSYFEFSNEQVREQQNSATKRSKGVRTLVSCSEYESSISFDSLSAETGNVRAASTLVEKKTAIGNTIDNLGDEATDNTSDTDKNTGKINFIILILKQITFALVNSVISPKLILLFVMNDKIINGADSNFENAIDFIKKNRQMFKNLTDSIKTEIINVLLAIVIKEITQLVMAQISENTIEMSQNTVLTLLSLVGVPQQILEIIRGL